MTYVTWFVAILSIALFAQSLFSTYLMLYSWEHPDRLEASRGPKSFLPPRLSFTVLLPARHEEAVIFETIRRVLAANYPRPLLEVVVICHIDDRGTVDQAQRAIRELGTDRVRVETFSDLPINKPHGLNVGFARTRNQVVTIFDAEDDIDADIFNVVNTVMLEEETGIVQAGVQLMNFRDHWFGMLNCLEYFFWFKSRLHFHAHAGMIPLGGNTVFMRRELIARGGGWDNQCLTEDADIGLRLSRLGEPIRVVYDAQHVTREETPASVGAFMRQRTRWHQGFIQVLRKGDWLRLPRLRQRLLAGYTLGFPFIQALLMLLWPVMLVEAFFVSLPVPVVMMAFLPLYALGFQYTVNLIGAYLFCREYGQRAPWHTPISMAVAFLPFQWLQGFSAVRAVYRQMSLQTNWEKTAHFGAHRRPATAPLPVGIEQLLDEARAYLKAERASLLLLDRAADTCWILASRGLPAALRKTPIRLRDSVAEWVVQTRRPAVINTYAAAVNGHTVPADLRNRLRQPDLRSAIVLPIERGGDTVAVLSVSSARTDLDGEAVDWLSGKVEEVVGDGQAAIALGLA
jgi:cellulose synthase/poly-beta-1,6-N-acetylglucosamine synthase-like glycosyltransferase